MIHKPLDCKPRAHSVIDITPEYLTQVAMLMKKEAERALPGEEIFVAITDRLTLKWDPNLPMKKAAEASSGGGGGVAGELYAQGRIVTN